MQVVDATMGENVQAALQSPRLPPLESLVTALINDIVAVSQGDREGRPRILVLFVTAFACGDRLLKVVGHA